MSCQCKKKFCVHILAVLKSMEDSQRAELFCNLCQKPEKGILEAIDNTVCCFSRTFFYIFLHFLFVLSLAALLDFVLLQLVSSFWVIFNTFLIEFLVEVIDFQEKILKLIPAQKKCNRYGVERTRRMKTPETIRSQNR